MSGGRSRINLQRFFKCLDRALVIQFAHAGFAEQEMGLFLLIHRTLPRRQATTQRQATKQQQQAATTGWQNSHGTRINNPKKDSTICVIETGTPDLGVLTW